MKLEVGRKYRLEDWEAGHWIRVLYVANEIFICRTQEGKEGMNRIDMNWLHYEAKTMKEDFLIFLKNIKFHQSGYALPDDFIYKSADYYLKKYFKEEA